MDREAISVANGVRKGAWTRSVAVDVYTADPAATSNLRSDVDELLNAVEDEKRERYLTLRSAREVVFFTFGMAALGRLSSSAEHFLRWLANCLPGTDCERDKFFQYWSRRIVVTTLKRQMKHLIARQEDRSPRYTRVVEEASRLDTCVRYMPGGDLTGLNRGTRRYHSAFRQHQISCCSVSLSMGG